MKKPNKKQVIRAAIVIVSAVLALYITSRFGHVIVGPRIILDAIPQNPITSPVINLSGNIKGGRLLWVNGTQIPVEQNGTFKTVLVVPPGYTIITLEAKDELGSERRKVIAIYYVPPSEAPVPEESTTPRPVLK